MDISEKFHKTDEIISKFKNGKRLFNESPLFNVCVQHLVNGADIYQLMEEVIIQTEITSSALEQQMLRKKYPDHFSESLLGGK